MSDNDTFKQVSVAALRCVHEALARKCLVNDHYLPIFAEVDAQLEEYETGQDEQSVINQARAKLRMRRSA